MTKKTPQNYTKQKEKEKQGNKQTNKKPPRTNSKVSDTRSTKIRYASIQWKQTRGNKNQR